MPYFTLSNAVVLLGHFDSGVVKHPFFTEGKGITPTNLIIQYKRDLKSLLEAITIDTVKHVIKLKALQKSLWQ